ncbi:hypothetical protein JOM56_006880 [Amanita muscaria]
MTIFFSYRTILLLDLVCSWTTDYLGCGLFLYPDYCYGLIALDYFFLFFWTIHFFPSFVQV